MRAACPRCRTSLDGGPVVYRCAHCHRSVQAADRVRATIRRGYAVFDLRPVGFCEFSAKLFVEPTTTGAWPITYWPGEYG